MEPTLLILLGFVLWLLYREKQKPKISMKYLKSLRIAVETDALRTKVIIITKTPGGKDIDRYAIRPETLAKIYMMLHGNTAKPASTPAPTVDHHRVLGVPKGASQADIKAAYRRYSKAAHPDSGGSDYAFKVLSESYKALLAK